MTSDSGFKKLEAEIEKERESIASLQGRVKDLVKRREDHTSAAKPEALSELQRTIDTLIEDRTHTAAPAARGHAD